MGEERLVPKLRFGGFDDEWKELSLIEISKKIGDGMHATPKYVDNSNYYFINGNNLDNKNIVINEDTKCVPLEEYEKHKINFKNTILISINGTIGNLAYYNSETVILGKSAAYINLNENINKEFIFNYLQIGKVKYYFNSELTGSTIKNLSLKTLKNTKIHIPSDNAEINKISNFLENIDNKIQLLIEKHQQYLNFKKYLMQQIFAQKLRFDFAEEWKKYLLGDISLIGKGFTPSTSNPSFWDGDLKWLSIADMNQGKYINQTTKTITYDGSKNKEPVKKGTLLMSFKLSIGKLGILTEDMYTNEAICNFKWKNKDVLTEYMYYYLSSINILKYGSQAAKGITLNNETLSTIPVLLPSLEEQKKIIDILSGVDLKINMLKNSIYDISKFKKGLLQQMFVYILMHTILNFCAKICCIKYFLKSRYS